MINKKAIIVLLILIGLLVFFEFLYNKYDIGDSTGTATLSWSSNTESDLAGYKIYYGTSPRTDSCPPGGYPDKIDVGKTETPEKPTYTIRNLEINKTYYFSITSYDTSNNESCFSEEISKIMR